MPGIKTLKELISLLYSERKILAWFFEREIGVSVDSEQMWGLINQDKARLRRLIEADILINEQKRIRLNYYFVNGLKEIFLQNNSPKPERVVAYRTQLKRQINYYQQANSPLKKEDFLKQINLSLWALRDTLQQTIIDIESWLVLSLREKENGDLFAAEVKDGLMFLDELEKGIKEDQSWMQEELFFQSLTNSTTARTWLDYMDALPVFLKEIAFLAKEANGIFSSESYSSPYINQIALLKKLSDTGQLSSQTNVHTVLSDLPLTAFTPFSSKLTTPSPDQVSPQESEQIARSFTKKNSQPDTQTAQHLSVEEARPPVNIDRLVSTFAKSKLDLFSFLKEYPPLADTDFEGRATLFLQLVSQYANLWKIEDGFVEENGIQFLLIRS
jgi:hypothetical protein